ncbi:hypothetical protein Tsubulata_000238 [Turnera subulata]|uniref:DNA repair RAD52-like protein 2, chloroplastic n=1 Tax=Turnera subulata TaxID=218843 RepID=A0A9Q0FYB0_9ROSI|nr:hypothetical protein Tsubulata_000238 [Turnera subulata]
MALLQSHTNLQTVFLAKSVAPPSTVFPSRSRAVRLISYGVYNGSRKNNGIHVAGGGATNGGGEVDGGKKKGGGGVVPNTNYVVPMDKSLASMSCITRPLAEILRDLNKRIPDNIVKPHSSNLIPCYNYDRVLDVEMAGWCGEIRDVIFAENGSVTVVYRVTVRGSDGEAHRESTGTVSSRDGDIEDPVAAAEEIAFCRACARFGLGLYLYHED